jgi:hypothetical protein
MTAPANETIDWRLTTWEGTRREQVRRWAALPLEQVIQAIAEMDEFSQAFPQSNAALGDHQTPDK